MSEAELIKWGAELGSDIGFFLSRGTAMCTGRGELIEPLPPLPGSPVHLIVGPGPADAGATEVTPGSAEVFVDGASTLVHRATGALRCTAGDAGALFLHPPPRQ